MKKRLFMPILAVVLLLGQIACADEKPGKEGGTSRIIFLHHSTGKNVWDGGVTQWFKDYNAKNGTDYQITEQAYPNAPYPWDNYPYDYWNLWVNHAGKEPFQKQATLEMLTKNHDVIVFKHCFPVSGIQPDTGKPNVQSKEKSVENYKVQYEALKKKLHEFPKTKFIIWTGAALTKNQTNEESAKRAKAFFDWVKNDWDEKGDNIYIWDFWELETEGGLYLKNEHAENPGDAHPCKEFCKKAAPLFSQRIVWVIQGKGDATSLTGK